MRYYDIQIGADSGAGLPLNLGLAASGGRRYASYANGTSYPGALNIELEIPVTEYALPMGAAWLRVWGVSLQDISQASDLNGASIKVYGGFQRGLPLANPRQAGLLVQGTVFQCFGNWQGTDQTLELIVGPATGTNAAPINISLNWTKGRQFSDAASAALRTAFPDYDVKMAVSSNLVLPNDAVGFYGTLTQFAEYVKPATKDILKGDYRGVSIFVSGKTIYVYDGTQGGGPGGNTTTAISFADLIGQPTWIEPLTIQFKAAMRADLLVGAKITMPPSVVTTTQQSLSQFRDKAAFQGTFQISQIRHIGNFRQPDANSWVTVVDAFPTSSG